MTDAIPAVPGSDAPGPVGPDAPAPGTRRPHPGRAPFLRPGVRVVLRYRIDPGASPHGEHLTDALGHIEATDETTVTVMTRRGAVRVVRDLVTAAKQVPPPPVRRPRPRPSGPSPA